MYRHLEVLHFWCADNFDNAPKNVVVQRDIQIIVDSIVEAQSSVHLALLTNNLSQRMEFLDVVVMDMTKVKTATKVLTEYSSSKERGKHVISKNARVRLLDIMTKIGEDLGRWRNSTLQQIRKTAEVNLPK